MAAGRSS
nr:growth hormone C transcript variant 4 [Ateles fusciceps]